jgi:RNA polymerase primary sigma factor
MARSRFEGMSAYLNGLSRFRHLTREEELELTARARRGDRKAYQTLATANLALVISVAKGFANSGARLDDLVQEGNVGLLKAIDHFDPKKGTRLSTYAVWWIRAYITRYLQDNRSQVRGGEAQRLTMSDVSLDAELDGETDCTHLERLVDPGSSPEDDLLRKAQDEDVREALLRVKKRLGELGWEILQERLSQESPRTLEEIGKRRGISRERVRQLELRIKAFLARYLEPLAA